MEVIHSVIAPALYSLLVSLPPLFVQSLPSTPQPHSLRHPFVAPLPSPSRFTANSWSFSPFLLFSFSFSFSPPCPCPSNYRLPRKNSPYKLEGSPPPLTLCLWSLYTVTVAPRTYYVNLDLSRLLALQSLRVLLIQRCGPPTNFTKHSVLHYTLHHIISTCIAISMSSRVLGYNTWLLFPFVLATSNKHVGSELQRMCLPSSLRNYRTMEGEVG
ncbi:unnamed protein product [Nakaseomyces glabratus]|uniref:Uncharacterized protein n=1 Tax=Candida glabrata (strain ATCC 2001 / BCRC 20586 / JCM 3761 / NBRC 0622 / NRRL Y-65 / CBS 138) TaxID=284593 RepID=Q6FMJ7_CANGA|nr:uncharacterized protein CAGL0K07502g [Nakaseomyces glabratus]CAG61510.1 unnamed protein product [Nakaseomyces glabratus]|eukprot:XP_448547.1 uncharacterized protein CAGL0K07502g [[Candida] glabrata]